MELATINLEGKDYVTVDTRLAEFRRLHPEWSIETDIINGDENSVTMKCVIKNAKDRVIGTGIAHEDRDDESQMCNKTSFYEVCETSAIGRAIAIATNIGNIGSIASADEVKNAIEKQDKMPKTSESIDRDVEYAKGITLKYGENAGKKLGDLNRHELELLSLGNNEFLKKYSSIILKGIEDGKVNFDMEEVTEEIPF